MTSSTARSQGEIGPREQPITININNSRAHQPAGLSLKNGRVITCVPANGTVNGGGPFRGEQAPARIAKSKAFHALKAALRSDPANCCRCGKPRDGEPKQCTECREYQARYRAGRFEARLTGSQVVAMVKQMRRELDKMQVRFKQWQKAAEYRRNLHYRTNTMRKKYLRQFSPAQVRDYLAQTNHAHANHES